MQSREEFELAIAQEKALKEIQLYAEALGAPVEPAEDASDEELQAYFQVLDVWMEAHPQEAADMARSRANLYEDANLADFNEITNMYSTKRGNIEFAMQDYEEVLKTATKERNFMSVHLYRNIGGDPDDKKYEKYLELKEIIEKIEEDKSNGVVLTPEHLQEQTKTLQRLTEESKQMRTRAPTTAASPPVSVSPTQASPTSGGAMPTGPSGAATGSLEDNRSFLSRNKMKIAIGVAVVGIIAVAALTFPASLALVGLGGAVALLSAALPLLGTGLALGAGLASSGLTLGAGLASSGLALGAGLASSGLALGAGLASSGLALGAALSTEALIAAGASVAAVAGYKTLGQTQTDHGQPGGVSGPPNHPNAADVTSAAGRHRPNAATLPGLSDRTAASLVIPPPPSSTPASAQSPGGAASTENESEEPTRGPSVL